MKHDSAPVPGGLLLLAAIVLVGLALRLFITGIGPLAADISLQTGLDLQGLSLLTLVPMFLMGALAFAGPTLQARVGARRSILVALAVLAVASLLRLFVWTGWQMVATAALLGLGAAVVQAMFPGVIKRHFPAHVSVVMGLYSAMLMGGGAVGAQLAPLIATATSDWHAGLAWMALPAFLALGLVARSLPADAQSVGGVSKTGALLRRPRTWLLMACFGLVNGGYSTAVAWLSPFYRDLGWSAPASGSLLAVMAVCQAGAALLLPLLANRREDRRPWLWLTLAMQVIGFLALVLRPEAAPFLWVAVLGAGLGGCFALLMIVALDHLPDPAEAGALSALMQGGGFLLAALPPWIVATLHNLTGGFTAGWTLHLCCAVVVAGLFWRMAPAGYARAMGRPFRTTTTTECGPHLPSSLGIQAINPGRSNR
ncbi:CP family cyanate transporter-like MFS transporter [Pseudaminobacter salicylatoxidans]|uniref:CP family cyanate transporter-like MFS transporter n=1 Tax=Pseudaminobacter salicylatoxidans TaxID=93369 RepID=A0A316C3C3_PSESE|nr:cyanate transporter [Pseudaminobacter salicylatoxidans]PWJ83743.1 CP family cyanate transporter-like MFS transporter [Pseudaminobacter salicylatoxidans]